MNPPTHTHTLTQGLRREATDYQTAHIADVNPDLSVLTWLDVRKCMCVCTFCSGTLPLSLCELCVCVCAGKHVWAYCFAGNCGTSDFSSEMFFLADEKSLRVCYCTCVQLCTPVYACIMYVCCIKFYSHLLSTPNL